MTTTAAELMPGDIVLDTAGNRAHAAFDVDVTGDRVRVWTANADRAAGWPAVLDYPPTAPLEVRRAAR
jgi:hypothetical protein